MITANKQSLKSLEYVQQVKRKDMLKIAPQKALQEEKNVDPEQRGGDSRQNQGVQDVGNREGR